MSKYDEYRRENNRISNSIIQKTKEQQSICSDIKVESKRVSKVIDNVNVIIKDADAQFEKATKLKGVDIPILFAATGMQCVRQYVIGSITKRTNHDEAAKKAFGNSNEQTTLRQHRLYNPSLEEIKANHVPFDTTFGSKDLGLSIGGGFEHRAKTLGHDCLLGWIFGTGNIATSTITLNDLRTYHVLTGTIANGAIRDKISMKASTLKMLNYTKNKLFFEGMEGKMIIGESIYREAKHLCSDMYSKTSLPIPAVSAFSDKAAKNLANYGIDMGNFIKVSSQAAFAALINSLIGMYHGLFYDESIHGSWSLYSVKTRKILTYSNIIASASNIIAVAIASVIMKKPKEALNYLDVGGIILTIYRLITDGDFITEVKKEFIENEWQNAVLGK